MNVNKIENSELRHFIENNPDADFKDVVDFCIRKFDDIIQELSSSARKQLQSELDNDGLKGTNRKLETVMDPYVRSTCNLGYYRNLQDSAMRKTSGFVREVDEIGDSHSTSFINSLKNIVHSEFEAIRMITPTSKTDLNSTYSITNRRMNYQRDSQEDDDRRLVSNLNFRVTDMKKTIYKQFVEVSQEDMKMYGITYQPGSGVSQNINVINGIKDRVQQLANVFNSTSDFFQEDIARALNKNNGGILDEIQSVLRECRSIMDESVYHIAREQKEDFKKSGVQDVMEDMSITSSRVSSASSFVKKTIEQSKEPVKTEQKKKSLLDDFILY